MNKLFYTIAAFVLLCIFSTSCRDTETYADLVDNEKAYIGDWIKYHPYGGDLGSISSRDDDWVNSVTKKVLTDSIHPEKLGIELNKWYSLSDGDFKRLYFCIRNWGDGLDTTRQKGQTPTDEEYEKAMRNKKKFYNGRNILVRYDSLYLLNDFNYDQPDKNIKIDNLDPLSFLIIYNWNPYYYSSTYYGYQYGSGSNYECTSGGLGFPVRFLWEDSEVSLICPFSLVETQYSSYYYTFYYGIVRYSRPNYLPQ